MILWDVNVLVYAFRSDSPLHPVAQDAVEAVLAARALFLFLPHVSSSFARIATNPRIFRTPSDPSEVWRFLDHLESADGARFHPFDRQAHATFRHLCLATGSRGNAVPDAMLAAAAIRYDAELVTADATLSRFPGVRTRLLE